MNHVVEREMKNIRPRGEGEEDQERESDGTHPVIVAPFFALPAATRPTCHPEPARPAALVGPASGTLYYVGRP
jgi:hypothetical protein